MLSNKRRILRVLEIGVTMLATLLLGGPFCFGGSPSSPGASVSRPTPPPKAGVNSPNSASSSNKNLSPNVGVGASSSTVPGNKSGATGAKNQQAGTSVSSGAVSNTSGGSVTSHGGQRSGSAKTVNDSVSAKINDALGSYVSPPSGGKGNTLQSPSPTTAASSSGSSKTTAQHGPSSSVGGAGYSDNASASNQASGSGGASGLPAPTAAGTPGAPPSGSGGASGLPAPTATGTPGAPGGSSAPVGTVNMPAGTPEAQVKTMIQKKLQFCGLPSAPSDVNKKYNDFLNSPVVNGNHGVTFMGSPGTAPKASGPVDQFGQPVPLSSDPYIQVGTTPDGQPILMDPTNGVTHIGKSSSGY
jgi:hypothetical protein